MADYNSFMLLCVPFSLYIFLLVDALEVLCDSNVYQKAYFRDEVFKDHDVYWTIKYIGTMPEYWKSDSIDGQFYPSTTRSITRNEYNGLEETVTVLKKNGEFCEIRYDFRCDDKKAILKIMSTSIPIDFMPDGWIQVTDEIRKFAGSAGAKQLFDSIDAELKEELSRYNYGLFIEDMKTPNDQDIYFHEKYSY